MESDKFKSLCGGAGVPKAALIAEELFTENLFFLPHKRLIHHAP
jgi:hypothetical protein